MTPKEKKQLFVVGIGVLLLLIAIPMNIQSAKKQKAVREKEAQEAAQGAEQTATGVALPNPLLSFQGPRDEAVYAKQFASLKEPWTRDPFVGSKSAVGVGRSELIPKLKGISMVANGKALAVLNEEIAQEGDRVDGYLVKKIESTQVVLERQGREFALRLEGEIPKK